MKFDFVECRDPDRVEQPFWDGLEVDSSIVETARQRISYYLSHLSKSRLSKSDELPIGQFLLSIENGIIQNNIEVEKTKNTEGEETKKKEGQTKYTDVCFAVLYDYDTGKFCTGMSWFATVPPEYVEEWRRRYDQGEKRLTVGKVIEEHTGYPSDNWFHYYGNEPRVDQIVDALNKLSKNYKEQQNLKSEIDQLIVHVKKYNDEGQEYIYKDLTPLYRHFEKLTMCIDELIGQLYYFDTVKYLMGIESRGFLLASLLSRELFGRFPSFEGFDLIRKARTSSIDVLTETYNKEYGTDALELPNTDQFVGKRVIICDDIIATGGTIIAAIKLLRRLGAVVLAVVFFSDISNFRNTYRLALQQQNVPYLIAF